GELSKLGRVPMLRDQLEAFARKELTDDDHVVIEATGNAASVAKLLAPFVDRVIIANPKQVRMIAHAKSRPTQSMRPCWPNSVRRAFCQKSGFPMRGPLLCGVRWCAELSSSGSVFA
ncbi:MAG: hypothetical protein WBN04_04610, partial [Paracoccaceae bacterium]